MQKILQVLHKLGKIPKFDSFLNFIYPPLCLQCDAYLNKKHLILCRTCIELLNPIDPLEHCRFCLSRNDLSKTRICKNCREKQNPIYKLSAVFDYMSSAATLIKNLKYSFQYNLGKGIGAYMAKHLIELNWPIPDVIIPVPITFAHYLSRGYNQSFLLAKSIGKILSCPVKNSLIRHNLDFSQTGLSHKQRNKNQKGFSIKKYQNLENKNLLIVDDVITTGSTLKSCAKTLAEEFPATIYALAFCANTSPYSHNFNRSDQNFPIAERN